MIKKSLKNALLYASATVGVGMLSGKENQLFVGGTANVMLFAVVFACANFLFGEWARQTNCRDGESLCTATFGKGAPLALFLLLAADTLTATAILSGTESALQKLTTNFPLPMFGVVICLVAAALSKGRGRAASIAARVSLALAAILLAATIGSDYAAAPQPPIKTMVYAMFCATMLLGLQCKNHGDTAGENALTAALTAALTTLLLTSIVLPIALHGGITPGGKAYITVPAAACFVLSASTGVYATSKNSIEFTSTLVGDKSLAVYVYFAFCLALSMAGADIAINFGYTCAAVVGTTLVSVSFALKLLKKAKIKKNTEYYE